MTTSDVSFEGWGDTQDAEDLPMRVHRRLIDLWIPQDFASEEDARHFYMVNTIGSILAVGLVALSAGLFLGLMTLDAFDLQIIKRSSLDDDEKRYATALYPIVQDRHYLLVNLLIVDALAYEILPLFLDKMLPGWVVLLLSITMVLLFGEIIPSAIFMGPQQLALGYQLVPLMKGIMVILYPVAKPCAMLLDYIVHGPNGEDLTQEEYNREELSALVHLQYERRFKNKAGPIRRPVERNARKTSTARWGALKQEMFEAVNDRKADESVHDEIMPLEREMTAPMEKQEVDVVVGALQMKTKVALDVFTPLRRVYALPHDYVLDQRAVTEIYAQGYSRVPVYRNSPDKDEEHNRSCVLGFLMTRQLMLIDWEHEREVITLPLIRPEAVSPRMNLVKLLHLLRSGGTLMAFVCARPDLAKRALRSSRPLPMDSGFMGIVTLEDVLESILQTKIFDENDIRDRDKAVATLTKWAAEKLQSFARKSVAKRRASKTGSATTPLSPEPIKPNISDSLPTENTPLLPIPHGYDNLV
eukprot:Nitzschia sp. Nitz4//scaffold36_size144017//131741//133324//NITZ4_003117-RA/size144017-processed-gene-0.95-mRNA-1//-1//CDS//3329549549//1180//frame0